MPLCGERDRATRVCARQRDFNAYACKGTMMATSAAEGKQERQHRSSHDPPPPFNCILRRIAGLELRVLSRALALVLQPKSDDSDAQYDSLFRSPGARERFRSF